MHLWKFFQSYVYKIVWLFLSHYFKAALLYRAEIIHAFTQIIASNFTVLKWENSSIRNCVLKKSAETTRHSNRTKVTVTFVLSYCLFHQEQERKININVRRGLKYEKNFVFSSLLKRTDSYQTILNCNLWIIRVPKQFVIHISKVGLLNSTWFHMLTLEFVIMYSIQCHKDYWILKCSKVSFDGLQTSKGLGHRIAATKSPACRKKTLKSAKRGGW